MKSKHHLVSALIDAGLSDGDAVRHADYVWNGYHSNKLSVLRDMRRKAELEAKAFAQVESWWK